MIFLEALLCSILFVLLLGKTLARKANIFYAAAVILAAAAAITHLEGMKFTGLFGTYIYPIFDRAALGTAFFVLVMFAGAFPLKSKVTKTLMPIRGQMSILAGILTLGHNIGYGKTYFGKLFTGEELSLPYRLAAICSLCMLAIMLPLWVTSFPSIRKKMKGSSWKKLQRWAYGFYGLLYIHIMLLEVPSALRGVSRCAVNAGIYTFIFLTYLCFRILRRCEKRSSAVYKKSRILCAVIALILGICVLLGLNAETENEDIATESADESISMSDGEFSGTAFGYEGDITVTITIKDGEITDGYFSSYSDDPDYRREAETMLQRFIENPQGEIDAVTGATFTSKGVLNACRNAVNSAKEQ